MKTTTTLLIFSISLFMINSFAQSPSIQWQKSFGGTLYEDANSVQQTSDGGYIVAGHSNSVDGDVTGNHGEDDYWVIKLNEAGTLQWQKSFGGANNDDAYSVQQTNDGGYIVAGGSASDDGDVTMHISIIDYWIVKLDNTGTIQWQKSFGGLQSEYANCIRQTNDGGYIIAGGTNSINGDITGNHGDVDYWIVKLDNAGTVTWKKCFGGTNEDIAQSIQQTSDGGYIVGGTSNSNDGDVTGNHGVKDYWILKLDNAGTIQWKKSLGGTDDEEAYSIEQTGDGGYIVGGYSFSNTGDVTGNHGSVDCWIVKLDNAGTIQWQKSLGGSESDMASYIKQTSDGGYIIAGGSASDNGDVSGHHGSFSSFDYWVVKLNSSGTLQWQKSLGGTDMDLASSIQQTSDGGYIVAGYSASGDGNVSENNGGWDFWIVKLAADPVSIATVEDVIFSIYPNPASTIINLNSKNNVATIITIYNATGQLVHTEIVRGNQQQLNVADLSNGVYTIEVTSKEKTEYQKLIIQH